jgi:LacI family transcriptional regulator
LKVTLSEVARRAGTSATTAARVIHGNGYVSAENRARVEQSIKDLDYRPNMLARGLRNNRSYAVGLVLNSATLNPFYTRVSHAVRTSANAAGLSVLNFNHTFDAEVEREGISRFIDHGIEAVFTCNIYDPQNYEAIINLGIPVIEIERSIIEGTSHLEFDPLPGMIAAVGSFLSAGHRKITFLGGLTQSDFLGPIPEKSVENLRSEAFLAALRHHGLDDSTARMEFTEYLNHADTNKLRGFEWARIALTQPDRPKALICGSDVLAAGVLQAAYQFGLRVPQDLAIAGYDDSLSCFLSPPIASVLPPYQELGSTLIEMITQIKEGNGAAVRRQLPTSFVYRPSL